MAGRTTPGTRLRALLDVLAPGLARASARMFSGDRVREAYLSWLEISYAMTRATVPLLRAALQESRRRTDPVAPALASYYTAQIKDESGHSAWVVSDYAAAGGTPRNLRERPAAPAVARLVGAQYYWLRHEHPIALLGHIAVLEWYPPAGELARSLAGRTGLPGTAFKTITGHALLDAHHGDRLARLLDTGPISRRQESLLTHSALSSVRGLGDVVRELVARAERSDRP
ncbi:iron-containing redox enzyme family protein [Nonomuraea angiospora]|uniref:iron-containing redox enzyme family protein n=1 Tax=Nonomuraea angiospora TaxID=46172 RepID=UPI00344FDD1C